MLVRATIATLLSTVTLFAWGAFFWMVSHLPFLAIRELPADHPAVAEIAKLPHSGVYHYPWATDGNTPESRAETEKEFYQRHSAGPLIQVQLTHRGVDPGDWRVFALGAFHLFVSSLLAVGLLLLACPALRSYPARWGFVVLAGVFTAVAVDLSHPVWLHQPWDYWLMMAAHQAGGWLFAGLALAAIVRAPNPASGN